MNEYLGIPYAAPPVGLLRWMPPHRTDLFPGLSRSDAIRQRVSAIRWGSEDCLFLNVFTPEHAASGPLL